MSSKKRKVDCENRSFNSKWENSYFCTDSSGLPQCLICLQVVSVSKEFNVKRHYETLHKNKYDKYTGEARTAVCNDLKAKLQKQKQTLLRPATVQTSSLVASYSVSLELAQSKKPFSDGEVIKRCAIQMARAFGEEKAAKSFETVSLSHQTVARRIIDMNEHVSKKLASIVDNCKYFSLALDESTDVTDVSQLMIFVKTIDDSFNIREELLDLVPLDCSTKAVDIYNALNSSVTKYGGFEKCSCIATDGASAMRGTKDGLVGLLRKNNVNCCTLHCIIHQEALCGKFVKMTETMKTVIAIVNLIRGGNKAHRHRQFIAFLDELDAEYGDLPLHCDVRWLSAGKCLSRFFSLRGEILSFLRDGKIPHSEDFQQKLADGDFLCALAFLTDITNHLNNLNLRLQGKQQNIATLLGHVDCFRKKLDLFHTCVRNNDVTHFPSCFELTKVIDHADFCSYAEIVGTLIDEFSTRFSDFENLRSDIELFSNPMGASVEKQPPSFQLELCELQTDPFLLSKKNCMHEEFWKLVSGDRFPVLRNFALKLCSMFGSTYICEAAFSIMKHVKSKTRNRLHDEALVSCIRLGTTNIEVDIPGIVKEKPIPQCSH